MTAGPMLTEAALDLLAMLVLPNQRLWGEAAVDVQWSDAAAVLAWASPTPFHFLTRARGYSKTSDLGAMAIAMMLRQLPPSSRLYAVAADRDQGRLLVEAIKGFAIRTPLLDGALRIDRDRIVAVLSGARRRSTNGPKRRGLSSCGRPPPRPWPNAPTRVWWC